MRLIFFFVICFVFPVLAKNISYFDDIKLSGNSSIGICFTPPSGCSEIIVQEIRKAKSSIYIQAFGFTSQKIIDSLLDAKNRGILIEVLLDRRNLKDKNSKIHQLQNFGIRVAIDRVAGIAHNKVMIIDNLTVITGSFNFTNAADNRNAENLLIIRDVNVAKVFLENWMNRNFAIISRLGG